MWIEKTAGKKHFFEKFFQLTVDNIIQDLYYSRPVNVLFYVVVVNAIRLFLLSSVGRTVDC